MARVGRDGVLLTGLQYDLVEDGVAGVLLDGVAMVVGGGLTLDVQIHLTVTATEGLLLTDVVLLRQRSVDVLGAGHAGKQHHFLTAVTVGSIEDLWGFNSERLARKIFAVNTPVISAVGHETDFTICDFVADKRAPTPSAAAELAVPDLNVLRQRLDVAAERACGGLEGGLSERLRRLEEAKLSYGEKNVERLLRLKEERLKGLVGKVDTLSPLSVLARGYAVVSKEGKALTDAADVGLGDSVEIRLQKGKLKAKVEEKYNAGNDV